MKKKVLIFTFDHELFLGERSGTVQNCMLEPVLELQKVAKEFGIKKLIFFLDTTFVQRLRENLSNQSLKNDFLQIKEQVRVLLENGHYVFPHIHPHWLDAELLENNQWRLTNLSKYCFKNCSKGLQQKVWSDAIDILSEFGVHKFHPIDAFRAGGWSIQPFDLFKPFFIQHGIRFDFTVMPMSASKTNAQDYDFSSAPRKSFYNFENDVVEENNEGTFIEFPISVRHWNGKKSLRERLLLKWLYKTGNRSFGDGRGVIPISKKVDNSTNQKSIEMISLELLNASTYNDYVKFLDVNDCVQFISHPKMLSPHNLKYFRKLLKHASQNYNLEFDFKSLIEK